MRRLAAILLFVSAIVLAGCGGGGGGGQVLTVTDDSGAVIQIDPSQSSLTVEPAGKPVANGTDQVRVVVTVRDVNGLPVANLRVSAEVSGSGNTLTQPAGLTDLDGRASATLTSTVAEIKTCKGFLGTTEIPQTGQVEFVAGPPTQLVFVVPPSAVVQDTCMTPPVVVGLRDAFGNACTTATNDVAVALGQNPGSGSLIGVATVAAVAGQATFDKLSVDMPADGYTLTAASAGLQGATSAPFNVLSGVGPGCAGGLPTSPRVAFVQQPGTSTAGATFSVQVALQDSLGNTLTSRTDAITLSLSTNPTGDTLQGTLTANAVAGVATFSGLKLQKSATGYRLGAAAAQFAPGTSDAFEVTAGPADHLAVRVDPTNAQAGVAIAPGVQIALEDVYGNLRTAASESVTIGLANNPAGATLSGTLTATPVNGVATFANLSLDRVGTGYTLRASSAGSTSVTTAAFDITPGAPSQLQFLTQPPLTQAGRAMDPAPQVRLLDAFGNPVPSGGVTVKMALGTNPSGGTLSGDQEAATVDGVATFSNLKVDKVGAAYTLVATALGYSGDESTPFNVIPGQASTLKFTTEPPAGPTPAGQAFTAGVSVYDSQGNLVSDSTAPITVALLNNGSGAVLGGTLTVNAVGGVATFSDLTVDRTQTGYALAATAGGLVGAESSAFAITHADANELIYVRPPQSTSAGTPFTADLMLVDRFGNTITSDSSSQVTVALTSNPTQAVLKGTLTRTVTQGEVSFTDLQLDVVGTYTLGAQTGGLTAGSASFDIGSAAPAKLVYTTLPSNVVAGQTFSCGVQVQDAYGNPVASYADPITLTLSGGRPTATLTGTNPRTPTAGTATFEDLAVDVYASNYKLTASSGALTTAVVDPLVVALPATPVTWYVDNTATPGGTGFSADPFATLAEAQATSRASDTIVVRLGDGTTTGYIGGITLKANQTLQGENNVIVGPVTVANNCTVQTLRVTNNTGGTAVTHVPGAVGGTLTSVTLLNSQKGFVFDGVSGTWTFTGCTVGGGFSGEAIELTNSPAATFAFRDLTVYSGKGLVANNAGQITATGTNSVSATGAAVLSIGNMAIGIEGLAFADLTSTDSTGNGLALVSLTGPGAVNVTGTATMVRPHGTGLWVASCPGMDFDFAAVTITEGAAGGIHTATGNAGSSFAYGNVAITNSGGAGLMALGGGLSVAGGSIATTAGPCLDLDSVVLDGAGLVLSSASSTNSPSVGMKLVSLGGQPVAISGGSVSGAFGTGLQVNGGSANITYAGNVTNTSAGMRVVSVSQRTGGTVTLTGLVTDNGGAGGGVLVSTNGAGSTVFGGACNLAVGANTVALDINNSGGSVSFPNGSLTASATGAGAIAMRVNGLGTTTVSGIGNTLQASNGAISFQSQSGPNVDFHGAVNHASTARAVDIQNTLGGTIRFLDGAVSAQGASGGIYVANCAGTVGFANLNMGNTTPMSVNAPVTIVGGTGPVGLGQVNLVTSGTVRGVNATDMGGTLSSTGGSVTSATGTAVFVDGPAGRTPLGMVLTRVSSNGAGNGLVLRDVNGSFEVVGDGGASANGTGGTIQNGTTGVVVERAAGVKLRRLTLTGHSDFGLSANLADGLTLQLLNVTNCGNGVGDAGMWMQDPRGLGTVTDSTVTASTTGDQAMRIVESSGGGTQSRVTITGSTFQDTYTSVIGSDALEARAATGGNLRVDVTGSTFRNTRTHGLQFLAEGTGRGALYVGSSNFTEVGAGLSLEASGTTASLTFDVYNNPQISAKSGFGGTLINLFTAGTATATGSFRGNTLTGAGNTVAFGHGVRLNVNEASSAVVAVTNSTIGSVTQSGIQATSRAGTGRLDVTVSGNSIPSALGYGIDLVAQDANQIYGNVFNNLCASPGVAAFRVRPADAGSFVYLQGFVDTVANLWAAQNNSPVGSVEVSGLGTVAAGTPLTP